MSWPRGYRFDFRRLEQVEALAVPAEKKSLFKESRNVAARNEAEALFALYASKNDKSTDQIEGILETLKGLGQLRFRLSVPFLILPNLKKS